MTNFTITTDTREHRSYEKRGVVRPDGQVSTSHVSASSYTKVVLDNWFFSRRDIAFAVRGVYDGLTTEAMGDERSFEEELLEVLGSDLKLADFADAEARRVGKYGKADLGTTLHHWAEEYDRGNVTLSQVPEAYRADIEAYAAATVGIEWTHIEQEVANNDVDLIGTADRFGYFRNSASVPDVSWRHDVYAGHCSQPLYVMDLKTGHSAVKGFLSMCGQLAGYAYSDFYDGTTNYKHNPSNRSTGFCIWLPAGTGKCQLLPINLRLGWRMIELSLEIRSGWRTKKADAVGRELVYTMSEADYRDLMDKAGTRDRLVDVWRLGKLRGEWTPNLSDYARSITAP